MRNQILHIISTDRAWFHVLRGEAIPEDLAPVEFSDRASIRAQWDRVEAMMREYLDSLRDEMLLTKPFPAEEDENLIVCQALMHVVNHGTDHRAQLLRVLNDLGVKTESQDYIFYVYEHPLDRDISL